MEYIDSEKVIAEVKIRPCLYDHMSEAYKNKAVRNEAWVAICKALIGESWEEMSDHEKILFGREIQKRWKALKDAFNRALKFQEFRLKHGFPVKPYVYAKQMQFLIPFMHFKSSGSGQGPDSPKLDNESDEQDNSQSENVQAYPKNKKRTRPIIIQEDLEEDGLQEPRRARIQEAYDSETLFFQSILPSIQKLSESSRLQFKIDVLTVLKKYMREQPEATVERILPPGEGEHVLLDLNPSSFIKTEVQDPVF